MAEGKNGMVQSEPVAVILAAAAGATCQQPGFAAAALYTAGCTDEGGVGG